MFPSVYHIQHQLSALLISSKYNKPYILLAQEEVIILVQCVYSKVQPNPFLYLYLPVESVIFHARQAGVFQSTVRTLDTKLLTSSSLFKLAQVYILFYPAIYEVFPTLTHLYLLVCMYPCLNRHVSYNIGNAYAANYICPCCAHAHVLQVFRATTGHCSSCI